MRAARWNHPSTVRLLAELGAVVDARDGVGKTALMLATIDQHADVVSALVARSADVNALSANGETALHHAARAGNGNIVKILLQSGASSHLHDTHGRTPWITAVHARKDHTLAPLLAPSLIEQGELKALQAEGPPSKIAEHMNKMYS